MQFRKTSLAVLIILGSFFFLSAEVYADTMWSKFGRGVNNVIFGWVELVRQPEVMHREEGERWPIAVAGGLLRGIPYSIARTAVGVYEILTFPIPRPRDFRPIMLPEHVVPVSIAG